MATTNQIRANQANAQKSTGPRTAEGKARSAQNGLTYGLYAVKFAVTLEDQAQAEALRAALVAQHNPQNITEALLVQQLTQAAWQLQRVNNIENGYWEDTLRLQVKSEALQNGQPPVPLEKLRHEADSLMGAVAQQDMDILAKLARQRAAAERSFHKTLQALRTEVKNRQTEPNPPQMQVSAEPEPTAPEPANLEKQQTEPNSPQTGLHETPTPGERGKMGAKAILPFPAVPIFP